MPAAPSLDDDASNVVANITAKLAQGADITPSDLESLDCLHDGEHSSSPLATLDRSYLLTASNYPTQTLVRHIGMVQDMMDPEYYVADYQGRSTHYRDVPVTASDDSASDGIDFSKNLAERQPLLVVPLPFCSKWLAQKLARSNGAAPLGHSPPKPVVIPESPPNHMVTTTATRKRDRGMDDAPSASKPRTTAADDSAMDCEDAPASPAPQGQELDWWPAGCLQSRKEESPVLAKLYYDQTIHIDNNNNKKQQRRLRLNDVVELIGVLSMDPWEADFGGEEEEDMFFPTTPLPPPSRLPRMHVLSYRQLDLDDLTRRKTTPQEQEDVYDHEEQPSVTQSSSRSVKEQLTTVLKDATLAETLWMTLLSTAERTLHKQQSQSLDEPPSLDMQRGPQHALGCASLQLTTPGDSKVLYQQLWKVLRDICPVVAGIPSTSALPPPPTKQNGRMTPSPWQLPKGATLLIHLDGPTPTNRAVVLQELVSQHRIPYFFEGGMRVPFDADYRIIVVRSDTTTTTAVAKLPCTLQLQVGGEVELGRTRHSYGRLLESVAACRRQQSGNIALGKDVLEEAQQDFLKRRVEARKLEQPLPEEADFHRWLTVTRLQTRGRGAATATIADWERALVLDDAIQQQQQQSSR
jgi:hypothetical protein